MDNSALPPEDFALNAEPIQAAQDEAISVAQDEEKELGSLLFHKGFSRLAADMKADIDKFRTGEFIKKPEDLSLEEVGKLFVIHQTVATILQAYLTKVEDAAKAVADAERAKLK